MKIAVHRMALSTAQLSNATHQTDNLDLWLEWQGTPQHCWIGENHIPCVIDYYSMNSSCEYAIIADLTGKQLTEYTLRFGMAQ